MTRQLRLLIAGGLLASGLSVGITPTQAAVARDNTMLAESEPNDTALEADGPIPSGGYIATRATEDDHDMFILRLQPQRQVTLTLRRVSGCNEDFNVNPTVFELVRSDGKEQWSFSNWSGESVITKSWTTPAVAAEWIGDISGDYWWDGHQCTVSAVVTPADAVIESDMPPPPPRDAELTPADIVAKRSFTTTVTGHAYSGDTLRTWFTKAGSECARPSDPEVTPVPSGEFSVPVTMKAGAAGYATVCMVLRNKEKSLILPSVTAEQVQVRGPRPLSVDSKRVRLSADRQGVVGLHCDLPPGDVCTTALTIESQAGRRIAELSASIPSGQTKNVSFTASRKVARQVKSLGVLELVASGTVTREEVGDAPTGNIRLLLLPPR